MLLALRLQVVFDDLINDLNLIVGLRMINRREVLLDAKFIAEFPELLAVELCAIVRNDLLRYVVSAYYCLPYKVLDFFARDRRKWFGFCPLVKQSTATTTYLKVGRAMGNGPMRSIPHTVKGHDEVMEVSFSGCDLGILENL